MPDHAQPTALQEAVARATCQASGLCKYVGPCNTGRCRMTPEAATAAIRAVLEGIEKPDDAAVLAGDKAADEYCETASPPDDREMTKAGFRAMIRHIKAQECPE